MLDKHFSPLTGMTLLSDLRARETIEELRELADWNKIYLRTGCPPMFQYPLARLFYFRKKRNDLFSKAKYFLSSKDYLIYLFKKLLTSYHFQLEY
jgi:gluconokinase